MLSWTAIQENSVEIAAANMQQLFFEFRSTLISF